MFGLGDGGVLNGRMDNRRTDEVADEGVVEVLHDAVEEAQHGEDKALSLVDCVMGSVSDFAWAGSAGTSK